MPTDPKLAEELERRTEDLGFEFVDLEVAGNRARPVLRLRIDRPDSEPGRGVTLDECTHVSRALQRYLDELPDLSDTYVLEVSSPGVERPLTRRRDFERFVGKEVKMKAQGKHWEGTLLGVGDAEGEEQVRIRLADGSEVELPLAEVQGANLIHRWKS